MIPKWQPLGAQLIPVLVREPYLPNNEMWVSAWFPGIIMCGLTVWNKLKQ